MESPNTVSTKFVETTDDAYTKSVKANENNEIEAMEAKIRQRALELMRESMSTWDDESVAALTDDEIAELTSIFIERAELEVVGTAAASSV